MIEVRPDGYMDGPCSDIQHYMKLLIQGNDYVHKGSEEV